MQNDQPVPPVPEISPEQQRYMETMAAYYKLLTTCDDKMSRKEVQIKWLHLPKEVRHYVKELVTKMPKGRLKEETINHYATRLNIQRALRAWVLPV
jgi:hypothetical protein